MDGFVILVVSWGIGRIKISRILFEGCVYLGFLNVNVMLVIREYFEVDCGYRFRFLSGKLKILFEDIGYL